MKTVSLFSLCFLLLLSSCKKAPLGEEVICSTIHRYGVPIEPREWENRGQSGQIVSLRKDGVTVTRSYDNGIVHGNCSYSYPYRETVQKKEIYNRGALQQEISYFPTGLPSDQIIYESPDVQLRTFWYENGAPQCQEKIEKGLLCQSEYYTPEQHMESQIQEGFGTKTYRNSHGTLEYIDQIEQGQTTFRTHFHPNGNPAATVPYCNGLIEGERRSYLPEGEPLTIEMWENDQQHGHTTTFEFGERRADIPYVEGKIHGIQQVYQDEKNLAQEITWVKGKKHGPCYTYIGNSRQIDWYFQDRKVPNKATFDMLSNQ